jgi:hypothetical protein
VTALLLASGLALFLGYRWGRWSRLRQLVQCFGSEQLCKQELVTMAERQRHRNLLRTGDKDVVALVDALDELWTDYVECEWQTTPEGLELRQALKTVADAVGRPLGACA